MPRIQFSKPTGDTWTPLPEGLYDWEIKDAKQTTSSKGNAQVELSCETIGPEGHVGRTTRMWYSLLPQSAFRLKKLLDSTGVDYEEGKDELGNDVLSFDSDDLIGAQFTCKVTLGENANTGNPRNDFNNESPCRLAVQPAAVTTSAPAPAAAHQAATTQQAVQMAAGTAPAPAAAASSFQPRSRRA